MAAQTSYRFIGHPTIPSLVVNLWGTVEYQLAYGSLEVVLEYGLVNLRGIIGQSGVNDLTDRYR